jgi:hypothetical protein
MLADDRPGYPMTFPVRVDFSGHPDLPALTGAFREALERHPLLNARIERCGRKLCWIENPDSPPRLALEKSPPLLLGKRIDLRQEAGVMAWLTFSENDENRGSIHFLFHHAACDGIGGLRFAGDVIALYARQTASSDLQPRLLPLQPGHLSERGSPPLRPTAAFSAGERWRRALRASLEILSVRPLVLRGKRQALTTPNPCYPMHLSTLSKSRLSALAEVAAGKGVKVNDLLLRDLLLTASQWNRREGRPRHGWFRIVMPTALMGKLDAAMPAANSLGFSFITEPDRLTADPEQLLKAVAASTDSIRKEQLGALFTEVLRYAGHIPGCLPLGARCFRRFSTLVLSNLGNPARRFRARFPNDDADRLIAGNLQIENIIGVPPIRHGTRAALGLFAYAGKLDITLNADPRWFSAKEAKSFLKLYLERLEQTASS